MVSASDRNRVHLRPDSPLDQHRINGNKAIADKERHWRLHLKPFFGNLRGVQVTTDLLRRYVKERKAQLNKWGKPPENSTINRELALLRSGFYLGYEAPPLKGISCAQFSDASGGQHS
jgi:hypothetical protein